MATLFDYLSWRGDLTFRKSPFNEVDSLILSRFSYLPFDDVKTDTIQTLKHLGEQFFQADGQNHPDIVMAEDITLLKQLMTSKRFKNLKIEHYVNTIHLDSEKQFSAMLIHLDKWASYVVFRGTDLTLVGWKEDLNLAFKDIIPAQNAAADYLNQMAGTLRQRLILGGHSKGGNLALYAGIFADASIQKKIVAIHNFDGPGFSDAVLQLPQYQTIKAAMHTYAAIVGYLFEHDHLVSNVDSSAKHFLKHDNYTWNVSATQILSTAHVPRTAQTLKKVVDHFLSNLSLNQREQLVNSLYQLTLSSQLSTITELQNLDWKRVNALIKSYINLPKEETSLIHKALLELIKSIVTKKEDI